jgi:uncharacterized LabA/DUF88 family protein
VGEFVYVDNSNVFIEGKRVSAVRRGLARDIYHAFRDKITDANYSLDFGRLHAFVAGDDTSKIRRAVLFGSRPPPNDSLWKIAERAGFETVLEDRNVANREKRIDTGIVTMMMRDAYKRMDPANDTITLVAGDGDYVPTFETLRGDGFRMELVFWEHASKDLKEACDKFTSLDAHLDHLQYRR